MDMSSIDKSYYKIQCNISGSAMEFQKYEGLDLDRLPQREKDVLDSK